MRPVDLARAKLATAGAGKVKADGKRVALDVKTGDLILFGKYSGQEIKLHGEDYLIMREDDVLAVIEGPVKQRPAAIEGGTIERTKSKAITLKGTLAKRAPRKWKKKR